MSPERLAIATLFLTLLGIVWKGGQLAGAMAAGLAELRAVIAELKSGLAEQQKDRERLAVVETKVETLEGVQTAATSALREMSQKLGRHSGEIAAVRQSSHDLGDRT
jgi:cell division protein FtsX